MIERITQTWAFGIVTLLGVLVVPGLDAIGVWPGPTWTAMAGMLALLMVHVMWGAQGYYPRQI